MQWSSTCRLWWRDFSILSFFLPTFFWNCFSCTVTNSPAQFSSSCSSFPLPHHLLLLYYLLHLHLILSFPASPLSSFPSLPPQPPPSLIASLLSLLHHHYPLFLFLLLLAVGKGGACKQEVSSWIGGCEWRDEDRTSRQWTAISLSLAQRLPRTKCWLTRGRGSEFCHVLKESWFCHLSLSFHSVPPWAGDDQIFAK